MFNFFIVFLFSLSVFAAPKSIEIWFVSNSKTANLEKILNQTEIKKGPLKAELACQEIGDYCFDPQFGLYKRDMPNDDVPTDKVEKKSAPVIPSAGTLDRDLINCDPKNYFDIFCGKAQKNKVGNAKIDLWIDTSSSMREFDPLDSTGNCNRKTLVQQLDQSCSFNGQVNVMMFDTSIKQAGSMDSLCTNQGLNDYKRLMDWIERSEANKLIIITDIYEFHKEFANFIEAKNGTFKGDHEALTSKKLLDLVSYLSNECK